MSFQENLAALASELGRTLPLRDDALKIAAFSFSGGSLIPGDPDNRAFRLFLESCVRDSDDPQILQCALFRSYAETFFAEISNDAPGTGKHPNLDLFHSAERVILYYAKELENEINLLWDRRNDLSPEHTEEQTVVEIVMKCLDAGGLRIAVCTEGINAREWGTQEWLKKAVLLSFKLNDNKILYASGMSGHGALGPYWDKVPNKFDGWNIKQYKKAGFRVVPPAQVRRGAYIGKRVVLMPSYVNVGAYIDDDTMIDTWATIGSCAQIGKRCHISGGAGIGGVLEPIQSDPVIIEDDVFIGARSEVVEGVRICRGAVLSMGVLIGKNTPIVDQVNGGAILKGYVPEYAVVIMGTHPTKGLVCPVIVKYRDEQTDAATALNDVLRE